MKKKLRFLCVFVLLVAVCTGCDGRVERLSAQKPGNDAVKASFDAAPREAGCTAQSYDMTVTLDTEKNIVSGYEDVSIRNTSEGELDRICFRYFAEAMSGDSAIQSAQELATGEALAVSVEKDATVVFVQLNKPLPPGGDVKLRLSFSTVIPELDDRFGYHREESGKMYLLTFWAPQLAMLENGEWITSPYFDVGESTYNQMSDYTVSLTAPSDYVIAASGTQTTKDGVTEITAPNVREMAIVACNYMSEETQTEDGITFRMYRTGDDRYEKLYDVMLANAKEAVSLLNGKIGRYLYDELDIIPAFIQEGGMEMPGLVIEALPESGREIQYGDYYSAAVTVAHEVAHQWFYCAIGDDQYREPWLDEAFATYYSDYVYHRTANDALRLADEYDKSAEEGTADGSQLYVGDQYVEFDRPERHYINLSCGSYTEADYGQYVYQDGAVFLNELHKSMGDAFDEMMKEWYQTYANRIVHGNDFIRMVLKYRSDDEVKELLNQFLSDENV